MKVKLILYVLLISMLLVGCSNGNKDSVQNPADVIEENNLLDTEDEQENLSDIEVTINSKDDIICLSKTMNKLIMTNIVMELTLDQQKELQELLHTDKWVQHEPEGRGVALDFRIRNDNNGEMFFFDGNGVAIIADTVKNERIYCIVPTEIVEELKIFAKNVRDEGIKNGNEHLTEQIKEFNSIIIGELEQLYDIKEEHIYPLSDEALTELHSMLKIEQWKVYEGSKPIYDDVDTPLILHKYFYNEDMLLQIMQYDDLYIAKSHSYAGPTDLDYTFEIPKEIYLSLIDFKENLEKTDKK